MSIKHYYDEADTILETAYHNAEKYKFLDLKHMVQVHAEKHFCAFGTGKVLTDCFHDLERDLIRKIDFVCDNDQTKWGKLFFGVKCLSPFELTNLRNNILIALTVIDQWMPIARQLRHLDLPYVFPRLRWLYGNSSKFDSPEWLLSAREQFKEMLSLLHDDYSRQVAIANLRNKLALDILSIDYTPIVIETREYFPNDIIHLEREECFVDAGAFDGCTLLSFLEECRGIFEHSYHFELEPNNYRMLEKTVTQLPSGYQKQVDIYPFGLWNENRTVSFLGEGMGTRISTSPDAPFTGEVRRLDDVLQSKRITMIKMDIEGAEIGALNGAANIIKSQHPKLAICVYHRLEDLWEIPLLIRQMSSRYKLHLRHYTKIDVGNVCYAVI